MKALLPYPTQIEKEVRVIILSDIANEADDHAAVIQSLLTPIFDVRGIVAVHFGEEGSMEKSFLEGKRILSALKYTNKILIPGAVGINSTSSKGAELIVEEAFKDDKRKLYVLALGALTDVKIALSLNPTIWDKFTLIWIGGEGYPKGGWEYNLSRDVNSAREVFSSLQNIWQIPRPVYSTMGITISNLYAKLKGKSAVHDLILNRIIDWNMLPSGAYRSGDAWTLGDSPAPGVLIYPHQYCYENVPRMTIEQDMRYKTLDGELITRVYTKLYPNLIFEDLFSKLELFSRGLIEFV